MHEPTDLTSPHAELDLDAVERDLEGVESALERLEAGTYWQCEATGAELPDELLASDPLVRRIPTPGA